MSIWDNMGKDVKKKGIRSSLAKAKKEGEKLHKQDRKVLRDLSNSSRGLKRQLKKSYEEIVDFKQGTEVNSHTIDTFAKLELKLDILRSKLILIDDKIDSLCHHLDVNIKRSKLSEYEESVIKESKESTAPTIGGYLERQKQKQLFEGSFSNEYKPRKKKRKKKKSKLSRFAQMKNRS